MKIDIRLILLFLILLYTGCRNEENKTVGVLAKKAMVVSAKAEATEIGLEILKQGGNAVDAAVGVFLGLAVAYPEAGNIGGGGFMVMRQASGEVHTLDFREMAPLAAHRDMYLDSLGNVIPRLSTRGHLSVGVPGSVAGMQTMHDSLGSLPWESLVQPAIDLAKQGVVLTSKSMKELSKKLEDMAAYNTRSYPYSSQKVWNAGDTVFFPHLAKTLEMIRDNQKAGFYEGWVADSIVEEMKRGGGVITHEDLKQYRPVWRKALASDYDDLRILTMPPPSSGGVILLQLLKSIEPYPVDKWGFHNPKAVHVMVEAERRAYADRARHLGDTDFYPVPLQKLMDPQYIRDRMSSVRMDKATPTMEVEAGIIPAESEQTTHFSIVDEDGNAVSITTTLNSSFGSCVAVGGAGFFLNNEMDDFSSKPGVPNLYGLLGAKANEIEPGKRMLSSMTPTIVERGDSLFMVVGTPGGSTIITSVFQTIVNVHEFGMGMQEAVSSLRFHHQWKPDRLIMEEGTFSEEQLIKLRSLGHQDSTREPIGRVDAIMVLPNGMLEGGADPRGDDAAMGY